MTVSACSHLSVVIPCYNMGRFLHEAVQSVLAQEEAVPELIVVDDGSIDDTPEHVARLKAPVRYMRQVNSGPAAARNRGIREASNEWIAFLDADDLWPRDKLRIQLPFLRADPTLDMVLGYQQSFSLKPGASEESRDYEYRPAEFIFLVGCGVYHRRVFERVGYFDENMRFSEDTDWFFRCREARVTYKLLPDVTVLYRHHPSSMTHGRGAIDKGFLQAIKRSLDRRRLCGQHDLDLLVREERPTSDAEAHDDRSLDRNGSKSG